MIHELEEDDDETDDVSSVILGRSIGILAAGILAFAIILRLRVARPDGS